MLDTEKVKVLFERTLSLAKKGWGTTHPNPMVGALIVEGGEVVSEGYHVKTGHAHAEALAISNLGRKPGSNASIFVSLEPCSTHGRTPPCVKAIIESGIKNIYIGCEDPNPNHSGAGIHLLRKAGRNVYFAPKIIKSKAMRLNFIFNHNMETHKALIALKIAETANGMVSEKKGTPSQITEEVARADMMHWRRLFPAISVGSKTVLSDNPSLTSRLPSGEWCPMRLILDSRLSILKKDIPALTVLTDKYAEYTVIITTEFGLKEKDLVGRAKKLGIKLLEVDADENGRINSNGLRFALEILKLNSVFCEGGPMLANSLLKDNQVDYLFRYRSKKIFDSVDAYPGPLLSNLKIDKAIEKKLGNDHLIHGFL